MANPFSPLLVACRDLLAAIDEPMAHEFVDHLDRAAEMAAAHDPAPCPFPALDRGLDLATDATRPAVEALVATSAEMPWRRPDSAVVPPGWAHRAATAELVGPDGVITPHTNERFGIFLLDTACDYPDHWHDAEELYLVLAGSGRWTVDETDRTLGAGDWSRTPSGAHHAILTTDQPVFAVYGWSGDTSYDSYDF